MREANNPEELGLAIKQVMNKYGKTATEAADWLYAQMATAGVPLAVLVESLNYASDAVLTLAAASEAATANGRPGEAIPPGDAS